MLRALRSRTKSIAGIVCLLIAAGLITAQVKRNADETSTTPVEGGNNTQLARQRPPLATPKLWVTDSMQRVGKTEPVEDRGAIELYAARGEYESFQVVASAAGESLENVQVSVSSFSGEKGSIAPANVELYSEAYVQVEKPSPDYKTGNRPLGTGWYPDALVPLAHSAGGLRTSGSSDASFSVAANSNQPIWVDIFVPRSAAAGKYSGTIQMTSSQGTGTVAVTLTVWNFTLPLKPSLKSSFGVHGSQMTNRSTHELLLRHKVMPLVVSPGDASDLAGRWGLNTTALWFQSGSDPKTCSMLAPPSVESLREAVAQYPAGLELYVYVADEIGRCPSLHDDIKAWARNVHQAGAKSLVTILPTQALYGSGDERPAVDIWVILPSMQEEGAAQVADAISRGYELWSYNALAQESYSPKWAIDYAPINYRIQPGFLNQSLGFKGILYWSVDEWTDNPWQDVHSITEGAHTFPGEGMLVYPSRQGDGAIVPSMRLKWIRDGVEDFEYIHLLKGLGQGSRALEISRSVAKTWKTWTSNPADLTEARRQLGQEIHNLSSSL